MKKKMLLIVAMLALLPLAGYAQNQPGTGISSTPQVQATTPFFSTTLISATAAVGSPAVLTLPAPIISSNYNYVCSLALEGSNDNTGTVLTNVVTTSANINSFAAKFSQVATASADTGTFNYFNATPAGGCAKSAVAGTATTFTSPTSTHEAYNWMATYYQAP